MPHISLDGLIDFGDSAAYRKLPLPPPHRAHGKLILDPAALRPCIATAFSEIAYAMPESQIESFRAIAAHPEASAPERVVAHYLLENAAISAEGIFPICQDTGTALIYGWLGSGISIGDDQDWESALIEGIRDAYLSQGLRTSQLAPLSMLEERNTRDNLPAAICLRPVRGDTLRLLCVAKGGGSTSRTSLTMESPAILKPQTLRARLEERIAALGASGCPPYTIAVVLGGQTPSQTLLTAELAALGMFDSLPDHAEANGMPIRSREWEAVIADIAAKTGIGAQWGGRHMAAAVRAIRLPRHAANLPLAVAVSCAANRHVRILVNADGWYIEKLADAADALHGLSTTLAGTMPVLAVTEVTIQDDSTEWLDVLRSLPAGTIVRLSGPVLVARDAAHARVLAILEKQGSMPEWFKGLPVFYAGPTEAKPGRRSGAFGPTTASRMDSYLSPFMEHGASLVSIGKGGRSESARAAIARHRGIYLAAPGGAAALTAERWIRSVQTIQFEDLGMEALRIAELDGLPALLAIDAQGRDFYAR